MTYTNYLLFNNIHLRNLSPTEEEMSAAHRFVHSSAREWFAEADLSDAASAVDTWIRPLLNQQSLDLVPAEVEDDNVWYIVAPWDREEPLALCYVVARGTDLNGYAADQTLPKGHHWMIRAINQARRCDIQNLRWVVLTNAEQWRLLDVQSLRCYEAFLEIDLYQLLVGEDDRMAAYLFYRLLRLEGSLERDDESGKNKLDALIEQSTKATEATERYLKRSVSDKLETPGGGDGIMAQLCMGLVHAIDPQRAKFFTEQERDAIYRDATYLLYRLLFILYAEARKLLPVDRADYQAVSLQSVINEAVELRQSPQKAARHPTSLWAQISTLFNAIQYSDEYLGIPAYNGGLFEDKDKPYLSDYTIENKFLAEALCELAFLSDPKGERLPDRIDYRDLSVRHLGSLYEGMIEYKLFIASAKLYARRDKKGRVRYLGAAKADLRPTDEVIAPGKVYFAQNPQERKATGTHYTAEELVERLVRQTVGRLLDERWAGFKPKLEEWLGEIDATPGETDRVRLRSLVDSQIEAFVREQVLSLRICDPAMGSGHFLVHIANTITNFILHVLTLTPWDNPAVNLSANYWRRLVVESCVYGVDINGMAVELAKLSLWLATMQPDRPLSFLDHHLKCGNSLLGARLDDITAVLADSDFNKGTSVTKVAEAKGQYHLREIPEVAQKVEQANLLLDKIAGRVVDRAQDIAQQEQDYDVAQQVLQPYKDIGDLLVARDMGLEITDHELRSVASAMETSKPELLVEKQKKLISKAEEMIGYRETFHWELEFPKLFMPNSADMSRHLGGFDVVIGNPPFLGGYKIRGELGRHVANYLRKAYLPAKGQADLCGYMFRRAFDLTGASGRLGMVATNTIGQGDTREGSLAVIMKQGGIITYVDRYVKWPGDATVEVNLIGLTKGARTPQAAGDYPILDGRQVQFISSWLDDYPEVRPRQLAQNDKRAFIGDAVRGMGFILDKGEATALLSESRNADCVLPYLSGRDLNSDPLQRPSRYVICFQDWSLEKAQEYPRLLAILEERVKPVRDKVKEKRERERWWLFARYRGELRKAIADLDCVLTRAVVSDTHAITFMQKTTIFNHKVVVFAFEEQYHFSILQSWLHELWMRRYASTMRTDVNYSVSDCFDNFPFPAEPSDRDATASAAVGHRYFQHRRQVMLKRGVGLTSVYNLLHSPDCTDADVGQLRELHKRMDNAVLRCYRWGDIDLQHAFHTTERGRMRFMPAPDAQREILTRLIALNQEIAEQEAAEALLPKTDTPETEGT